MYFRSKKCVRVCPALLSIACVIIAPELYRKHKILSSSAAVPNDLYLLIAYLAISDVSKLSQWFRSSSLESEFYES